MTLRRTFERRLTRVLTEPPWQTVKRAADFARRRLAARRERQVDFERSTYPGHVGEAAPVARLRRFTPGELAHGASERAALAAAYLDHRFDRLGLDWVATDFGAPCPGLEGHSYDADPIIPDASGDWLFLRTTAPNLAEAVRLWRLIGRSHRAIDWQRDLRSGYRWPLPLRSAEVLYGHLPGVDIKVPWELGRLQHLPVLALAAASAAAGLSGFSPAERYVSHIRDTVLDFAAQNPPRFGVQWACTMDVAIRAANLALAWDLARAHGLRFDAPFETALTALLVAHGRHILAHLEWNDSLRGNHYLCNLAGLAFCAAYLPASGETDAWLSYALHGLAREEPLQFDAQGANFEASIPYHRLAADTFVYAAAVLAGTSAERLGRAANATPAALAGTKGWHGGVLDITKIFARWRTRSAAMADFVRTYTRPDGSAPRIGDDDSGRFVDIAPQIDSQAPVPRRAADEGHADLCAALDAFAETDAGCPNPAAGLVRALAGAQATRFSPQPRRHVAQLEYTAYPQFGLYVWRKPQLWLAVRCGPNGQNGFGGHAHNDQLSFELALGGATLIVDRGTYVYTPLPALRHEFRATASHNTLALDGAEQNRAHPDSLFRLIDDAHGSARVATAARFEGGHAAFPHVRELAIGNTRVAGMDRCMRPGRKRVLFYLHPEAMAEVSPDRRVALIERDGVRARLSAETSELNLFGTRIACGYGRVLPSRRLELSSEASEIRWSVELVP